MLAGAVFALVDRALRATPDVFAHPAVEFVLGAVALRHASFLKCVNVVPGTACVRETGKGHRFTGMRGQLRRSEEHTSELQSLMRSSYAVFCLQKKKMKENNTNTRHPYEQTHHHKQ